MRTEASRTSGRFEAKWFYRVRNECRTFYIHYRLKGGIVSYPEVSELYWQIIGGGWAKPTGRMTINVHFPEATRRMRHEKAFFPYYTLYFNWILFDCRAAYSSTPGAE